MEFISFGHVWTDFKVTVIGYHLSIELEKNPVSAIKLTRNFCRECRSIDGNPLKCLAGLNR